MTTELPTRNDPGEVQGSAGTVGLRRFRTLSAVALPCRNVHLFDHTLPAGGQRSEAASCPQAPSISWPRVSRTVTGTPCASMAWTNARSSSGREAVHFEPGVGFSGIRFTWTRFPFSSRPSRSPRHAWSLMSRISAYSIEIRRPDFSAYSHAASSTSRTFQRVLTGTRVSRSSSSGACSDTAETGT